jgi:hypothetical protein
MYGNVKAALVIIALILILAGCIDREEPFVSSSKNLDPIPVVSISGTVLPEVNQTLAYAYDGATVTFDASNSYDPDGEIVFYEWILDETNIRRSGPVVSHTYDIEVVDLVNIVEVILILGDDNGSIVYHPFNLGVIPERFIFYFDLGSLKNEMPEVGYEKVEATMGRFRQTERLNYSLDEAVPLLRCKWSATINVEKPFLGFISRVSLVLYNSTGGEIAEGYEKVGFFGREKTVSIDGFIDEPRVFKSLEVNIYGFSLGERVKLVYGGESFISFDFTAV